GTIYVIEVDSSEAVDLNESGVQVDAHAMDPLSVLSLARSLGGEIGRIFIVGCEPLSLGPEEGRMGLSEPVSAAVDEAVRAVESLVNSIFCWKVEERDEESIYAQEQENESSHSERYRRSAARRGGSRSGCDSS
ncbi:MAG: hypothetical protein J2P31_07225, partial [Blastocatellia bacterium]|nr:hypothetical protein [Blastocatellia bacterium]